jgi:hypothetical protein
MQQTHLEIAASAEQYSVPVGKLHVAFKIPYMYDYITKLCRTQAELIVIHVNPNVLVIGQGMPGIGSIRG